MTTKKPTTARKSRKDSNQDVPNNKDISSNKEEVQAAQTMLQTNYKMANFSILFLMIIAGVVSGALSYYGAESIYNNKLISIPFAIVVEGVIVLTLWLLPKRLAWEKVLLMSIWAIGVTFSILSAHLESHKGTVKKNDLQIAKNDVFSYISGINDHGKDLMEKAQKAHGDARAEENGKFGSTPGSGPEHKRLLRIADAADQKYEAFKKSVEKPIQKATTNLDSAKSLGEVQKIFFHLMGDIPDEYRSKLKSPNIAEVSADNPLRVILSLLGAISDVTTGKSVDNSQAQEIMALAVASLMEVMALLLGLARVVLLRPIKSGTLHKKLHSMIAWVLRLPYVWRDAAKEVTSTHENKPSRKTSPSRRNRNTERKPNLKELVDKALHSDANENGIPYIKIVQQVSGLRGTRSGGNNSIETFTIKNFKGLDRTLRAMEIVDAIKIHSDEKIVISAMWNDFINYIFAQAAIKAVNTPKAARHAA